MRIWHSGVNIWMCGREAPEPAPAPPASADTPALRYEHRQGRVEIREEGRRWESRLRMWSAGVRAPEHHLSCNQPIGGQQIPTWSVPTNPGAGNQLLSVNTTQWALSQRRRKCSWAGWRTQVSPPLQSFSTAFLHFLWWNHFYPQEDFTKTPQSPLLLKPRWFDERVARERIEFGLWNIFHWIEDDDPAGRLVEGLCPAVLGRDPWILSREIPPHQKQWEEALEN